MADYKAFLRVHKPDCMKCGHLVEFATDRFDDCHHSRGNQDCPARVFAIQVGINTEALINAAMEAKNSGNFQELSIKMAQISELSEPMRGEVLKALAARETGKTKARKPRVATRSKT